MNILIIAFYFPPEDSWAKMSSLRPHSWFKYWSRLGHNVYVLTDNKPTYSLSPDNKIVGVKYWPSRPQPSPDPNAATRILSYSRLRKSFSSFRAILKSGSFIQSSDFWLFPALSESFRLHRSIGFDLVVSTFGPPANHWIASAMKKYFNVFWTADYRDLWSNNYYTNKNFFVKYLEHRLESSCISNANIVTTVSKGLSRHINRIFDGETFVIENGFDLDDMTDTTPVMWDHKKFRMLYSGSFYPGKQDPFPLLRALNLLKDANPELLHDVEVLIYGWNLEILKKAVKDFRLEDIVLFGGSIPRHEILSLQKSVDALIFLDWNEINDDGVLTGKFFEYIFSGRPILAMGANPGSAVGTMLSDIGVGIHAGSSISKITNFIRDGLTGDTLNYNPNNSIINNYTRKVLAEKMLNKIVFSMNHQNKSI